MRILNFLICQALKHLVSKSLWQCFTEIMAFHDLMTSLGGDDFWNCLFIYFLKQNLNVGEIMEEGVVILKQEK